MTASDDALRWHRGSVADVAVRQANHEMGVRQLPLPSLAAGQSVISTLMNTASGAEILLAPGTYRERIVLDRPVVLTAREGPGSVRFLVDHGPAVTVRADAVLRGLVIESADPALPAVLIDAGSPRFQQCEFRGARVETGRAAAPFFHSCEFRGAALAGLYATGRSSPRLHECTFTEIRGHAIVADEWAAPQVLRATILRPAGAGLRASGGARADLADCTITGSRGPGVMVEEQAAVRLRACRIHEAAAEGIRMDGSSPFGHGRGTPDPSQAFHGVTVTDCEISGAATEGLVAAAGEIRLERTRLSGAGRVGVLVQGGARLLGRDLIVTGSGTNGIVVTHDASVDLGEGECTDTTRTAIHLDGHASLKAVNTRIGETPEHGVEARGHAMVDLTGCVLDGCGKDGIRVAGFADATLRDCRVSHCRTGIILATRHHPVLDGCTVSDVERTGVTIGPGGTPLLRGCGVVGAGATGIFIDHRGMPQIRDCRIERTGESGIVVGAEAAPNIHRLTITGAGKHGLHFHAGARGVFEDCDIVDVALAAVELGRGAVPVIRNCRTPEESGQPAPVELSRRLA